MPMINLIRKAARPGLGRRRRAARQREIAPPIATLDDWKGFVPYCSLELIISGRAPGRGSEGTMTGNHHP